MEKERFYKFYPGKLRFCLSGRCIWGPKSDTAPQLAVWALIFGECTIFYGFLGPALYSKSPYMLFLCVLFTLAVIALLFDVSFGDPGVIPRDPSLLPSSKPYRTPPAVQNLQFRPRDADGQLPDPPEELCVESDSLTGSLYSPKWCTTCKIYRPRNAHHCRVCDHCVREFDHHCMWVGACVADRNRRSFIALIATSSVFGAVITASCCLYLYRQFDLCGSACAPGRSYFNTWYKVTAWILGGIISFLTLVTYFCYGHVWRMIRMVMTTLTLAWWCVVAAVSLPNGLDIVPCLSVLAVAIPMTFMLAAFSAVQCDILCTQETTKLRLRREQDPETADSPSTPLGGRKVLSCVGRLGTAVRFYRRGRPESLLRPLLRLSVKELLEREGTVVVMEGEPPESAV